MTTDLTPVAEHLQNPHVKVRISPDTYMKFDGSEHVMLQNIGSEQGMRIKFDIMLILYEMIDWKSVGEITAPWPPDDQVKILDHLEMMNKAKIVQIEGLDGTTVEEASESGLGKHVGKHIHINSENHLNMMKDHVRMVAYQRAIERNVTPETVAMDLGCGTGILSLFAARAGAQKVYAIERQSHICMLAEQIANNNGYGEQIEFIDGASNLIKADRLTPKPDLMIAEIIGNGILEENIIEFTLDARERFLKPGGKLLPYKLDIHVFAYRSPTGSGGDKLLEIKALKDLYGFDFDLLGQVLESKSVLKLDRYASNINKTMTEPEMVHSLDFTTLESAVFTKKAQLMPLHDGEITGLCAYFTAWLDEETILTNSPWTPQTHWTHLMYTLTKPVTVKANEPIDIEMIYDGSLRVNVV
ncbi:MAG: 50S ribosomal protein L11 methyltransferase [Vampirovibrionales bacterium]|nr:50S ribosomal protein L11 methyltransferase [Vampirovibrionales bacterium]